MLKSISTGETPILNEEDYIEFLKKVDEGLNHPVGLVLTPKIEEARKLIKEYRMEKFLEKIKNSDPETLECIYDIVLTIFINQEINKIDFNDSLNEPDIDITNVISKVMVEIGNNEICPTAEVNINYENNTATIDLTFRDGATTCIGPMKFRI